ncbi:hypothetical protein [Methylomonas sp. CM2]|uniref:hypothetical protein n=1 Tax=Methylomonas sp. CM2 TaxID=3417647 RepID=UPI003CE86CDF
MTSASQRGQCLDHYRRLPAEHQTIVKLLAMYYGYCSLTTLAKCLASLGIKEGGKVLKSESVKARIKPLIAAGLLEENPGPAVPVVRGPWRK